MGFYNVPLGMTAVVQDTQTQVFNGDADEVLTSLFRLASVAVDSSNTPTTTILAGNCATLDDNGEAVIYDGDGYNGVVGVFHQNVSTLNAAGTAVDKSIPIAVGGFVKTEQLEDSSFDAYAKLWALNFTLDKNQGAAFVPTPFATVQAAADKTLTSADNGKLIVVANGKKATLPTIAHGLGFVIAAGGASCTVAGYANIQICDKNLSSYSDGTTLTGTLGSILYVRAEYNAGTLAWFCEPHGSWVWAS